MKIKVVQHFKTQPWKNGLGSTQELLIHPASADVALEKFEYRISSAVVTGSSTFSSFTGYRRIIVLLNGAMTLSHESQSGEKTTKLLEKLTPHFFSGDDITTAKANSGNEMRDLNFIYRPQKYEVKCEILTGKRELTLHPGKSYFLFSVDSKMYVEQQEIPANKLAIITTGKTVHCQIFASSTVLFELRA